MKRTLSIAFVSIALTGCAGLDLGGLGTSAVQITDSLQGESTSGSTRGMSSADAAYVMAYRAYAAALKAAITAPAQPILEIEALDGQPIQIIAKSLRVYAPRAQGQESVAVAPEKPENAGILWFREIRQALASVLIPWRVVENNAETQRLQITTNAETRKQELEVLNGAVTGSQGIASQAITSYEPVIVQVPAAPAATE